MRRDAMRQLQLQQQQQHDGNSCHCCRMLALLLLPSPLGGVTANRLAKWAFCCYKASQQSRRPHYASTIWCICMCLWHALFTFVSDLHMFLHMRATAGQIAIKKKARNMQLNLAVGFNSLILFGKSSCLADWICSTQGGELFLYVSLYTSISVSVCLSLSHCLSILLPPLTFTPCFCRPFGPPIVTPFAVCHVAPIYEAWK